MAFTVDIRDYQTIGRNRIVFGKYTSDGGTAGGDIVTGLNNVFSVVLTPLASSVSSDAPVCSETLPLASGTVTIVTTANALGSFIIIGN